MLLRPEHDLVADQRRRAQRRIARPGCLMTRRAVSIESRMAPRHQIIQAPRLVRIIGRGGELALVLVDPLGVVLLGLHLDDDRHEAMLLAAQLGALAAIDADLVSPEPGVPNESRNRVLLDAE